MNISNSSVRFGMVIGPMDARPNRVARNEIFRRTGTQGEPFKQIRYHVTNAQQQRTNQYFLITGSGDIFQYQRARQCLRDNDPIQRENGEMLIENLTDRAIKPENLPRL